jgi:pimeloyl-ACP methyl ester carboxylesterase
MDSLTPGQYSFWFSGDTGHARVGEILAVDEQKVVRQLLGVEFGDLAAARRGRFSGWFYLSPADLGFPSQDVEIGTPVGAAPAWLIPAEAGTSDDWAIMVHGRAVTRSECLRAVPTFRGAGYTSLIVSYRNDGDAPNSDDHRYALGDREWEDVSAAVDYALGHGAERIVFMGWSMGGATVLQAVTRAPNRSSVRGVVLESPVVDWVTALQFQGVMNRLPRLVRWATLRVLSNRWGTYVTGQDQSIDLARLDIVRRAGELRVPILLLHSNDDGYIPATASRALAQARPDIVTYEEFAVARHTKLWNYDAPRWTRAIARWLAALR